VVGVVGVVGYIPAPPAFSAAGSRSPIPYTIIILLNNKYI